jgi:uncharacterized membrane protein YeiH
MLGIIEFLAVVTSAVYGIVLATRKGLDVVGVAVIASVIAFGGGTLRDVLLDRRPLFWMAHEHYVVIVLALAVVGSLMPRPFVWLGRHLALPDALGLALYSLTGVAFALQEGASHLIAVLMGVITGTFGGVIAEVLCNEIPSLFRPMPLYATCAFLGAWAYLGVSHLGWGEGVALAVGFSVIFLLRMGALRWRIILPAAKV